MNRRLPFLYAVTILHQAIVINTVIMYWPDVLEVLNALTTYAYGFQAIARVGNYNLRPKPAFDIQMLFEQMYEESEIIDEKRRKKLKLCMARTKLYTRTFVIMNFIGFHLPIIDSFINRFLFGANSLPLFGFLPYTNALTEEGFWINFLIQLILLSGAFFGFSTYDAAFILFSMQSMAFVDLFEIKLIELEEIVRQRENQATVKKARALKEAVSEIVKFHELFNHYIDVLRAFTIVPSFAAITINTLAICICILTALTRTYFGALGIIISFFFQIFIPCTMGTFIITQVIPLHLYTALMHHFGFAERTVC